MQNFINENIAYAGRNISDIIYLTSVTNAYYIDSVGVLFGVGFVFYLEKLVYSLLF